MSAVSQVDQLSWANDVPGRAGRATGNFPVDRLAPVGRGVTTAPDGAFAAAWAEWIRAAGAGKEVARLFGASPRTVEGWREGGLPQVRHLAQAVALWGAPFLEAVFAPLLAGDDSDLLRRLERVRADMTFILETTEALRDAETACHETSGPCGPGAAGDAVPRPRRPVARAARLGLARSARTVVAVLVVAGLSLSLAAGGGDQQMRLRGRGRPAVARVVSGRGLA